MSDNLPIMVSKSTDYLGATLKFKDDAVVLLQLAAQHGTNEEVLMLASIRNELATMVKRIVNLSQAEIDFMKKGMKINAIKEYRARTGASLLDAKNVVEAWATATMSEARL